MMNRRSFLRRASGIVAAGACALFIPAERLAFGVPKPLRAPEAPYGYVHDPKTGITVTLGPPPYVIVPEPHRWADGIHDDAPWMQWQFDRQVEAGGGVIHFPSGTYRFGSTVHAKAGGFVLKDSTIIYDGPHAMKIEPPGSISIGPLTLTNVTLRPTGGPS